jgi:hypothetical protein
MQARSLAAALFVVLAVLTSACGPTQVEWNGSCTATCADGTSATLAQTVCGPSNSNPDAEAQAAVESCLDSIAREAPECESPTCGCVMQRTTTEC